MYLKLDKKDLEIVKKVSDITNTDYELEGNMFPENSIIIAFEDLIERYGHLEEELEDLKQDLHDNYRPISLEEMYD